MERSEIMELRKLFKTYSEDSCPVNGFCGGYITPDCETTGTFSMDSFHDAEDPVKKRIFTFVSKTISNNATTLRIDERSRDLLNKIVSTKAANKELHEELCDRIAKAIRSEGKENAYTVTLLGYTYDPPCKTSDHKKVMDGASDIIYRFVVCMISPVTSSSESFGYHVREKKFGMNPILHIVGDPICGFTYPDFTGREPDDEAVLYFKTDKLDIAKPFFGSEAPASTPKTAKPKTDTATIGNESSHTDTPTNKDSKPAIPSLDTGTLSMEETKGRDIASEKKVETAEDEEKIITITADPTPLPFTPEPRKKKVRITGDTKTIKKQVVDGVMCLVIPVSDADLG